MNLTPRPLARRIFHSALAPLLCAGALWLPLASTDAQAETRPEFPEAAHRLHQPAAGPPAALQLPKTDTFALPNGVQVVLVTRHTLPTVQLVLEVPGGTQLDAPGHSGETALCMALGGEATLSKDRLALREALADIAAGVSAGATDARLTLSLSVLKGHAAEGLAMWADVLLHPAMGQGDLDRLLARRRAAISQQKASVGALAGRLQGRVAWGATHPHGQITTAATLRETTTTGCAALWQRQFKPKGATLYVVGDLTRSELLAMWTPLLHDWQGQAPAMAPLPPPGPTGRHIFVADVPGSPQASLLVATPGPSRQSPTYAANSLLAAILGNGFSSRINMNLREAHGWAYGARGNFDYTENQGLWLASASVRLDATGPALAELLKEMDGVRMADVTADEISREREGTIAGLPARWATSDAVLGGLRRAAYFGLPLNDDATLAARLTAVTAASIRDAAQTWIHPESASILVVGDLRQVLPQLAELQKTGGPLAGWGLTRLDADGGAQP